MHLRPPTPSELEGIERTRQAYRAMWAELVNVPERRFEGDPEDIDTLNFIDYEAGDHPEGASGAAIIFGGVLVKTGLFEWAIGDETHLVLVTTTDYPRVMIYPYARMAEVEHSSWPAPGNAQRFDWLLEEVALRLWVGGICDDRLGPLLALVGRNETLYWNSAKEALATLKAGRPPEAG